MLATRPPRCSGACAVARRRVRGAAPRNICGLRKNGGALPRRKHRCSGTGDEGEGVLFWEGQARPGAVAAPVGALPIVLLPGFGNNMSDYEAPFRGDTQEGLAPQLRARGWHVETLPLKRKQWFNVARGLLRPIHFWRQTLTSDPSYTWYIQEVASAVQRAREATGASRVHLLGHSAGGWLARAFAGGAPGSGLDPGAVRGAALHPLVASITTLGTPQRPPAAALRQAAPGALSSDSYEEPPADGGAAGARQVPSQPRAVRDMTGGALQWVDTQWPGAALAGAGVAYVTVAGRAVRGCGSAARAKERSAAGYAHGAYIQVCGEGDVWGDCVVPTGSALLPGARHVVLNGVRHSMARIGTWDERPGPGEGCWYGSPQVLDSWLVHIAEFDA